MAAQTQRQFDFLHELITQRDLSKLPERQRVFLSDPANIQRMNKQQSSNAIAALLECPRIQQDGEDAMVQVNIKPDDPALYVTKGRYFITDPTDGVEKFIHVDKPTEGRWAGYTFVNVRASDDLYPIRERNHREAILAEIAKDPVNAMSLYGEKLGVCGRCGRTLTQIDSRLRGLGPICAGIVREEYGLKLNADDLTELLDQ